tara:strand:- start:3084 stop:3851 length:768 start_codon:yes stop_codon:yes gene_type:complete
MRNLNYILLLLIIFIGCENLFNDDIIYGCLDETACNYSSTANTNDSDLCKYPAEDQDNNFLGSLTLAQISSDNNFFLSEVYSCDGQCININFIDDCGICGGSGTDMDNDGYCDNIDPCLNDFTYVNDEKRDCNDIQILFELINLNPSLQSYDVYDIGTFVDSMQIGLTVWNEDGKLTYLSLASLNIKFLPDKTHHLSSLIDLYINDNNIESLPDSLCYLPSINSLYAQYNYLCPEYSYETEKWDCISVLLPQICE